MLFYRNNINNMLTLTTTRILVLTLLTFSITTSVFGTELTFELPDNARECFYEVLNKEVKTTLEFQVVTGGNYDVDVELLGPNKITLYKEQKKQYDSFTWTTSYAGEYSFCFSNEFSTFTHKVIYFDFQAGEERPILPDMAQHATAMTQMEASSVTIHESLKVVIDYQTHHRLRELTGRAFAEDLNERTHWWSLGESVVILIVGVGQVLVLRSFFTDKRAVNNYVST